MRLKPSCLREESLRRLVVAYLGRELSVARKQHCLTRIRRSGRHSKHWIVSLATSADSTKTQRTETHNEELRPQMLATRAFLFPRIRLPIDGIWKDVGCQIFFANRPFPHIFFARSPANRIATNMLPYGSAGRPAGPSLRSSLHLKVTPCSSAPIRRLEEMATRCERKQTLFRALDYAESPVDGGGKKAR